MSRAFESFWVQIRRTFHVSLVDSLPPDQRAAYYRKQAAEALQKAGTEPQSHVREGFLRLAAAWHGLAAELEKIVLPVDGPEPDAPAQN